MNTFELSWSVKGYHFFRIKHEEGEILQVQEEHHNRFDPNAMSVLRQGGVQVGRVPANLCGAFRHVKRTG
jgi:hypothetical protein